MLISFRFATLHGLISNLMCLATSVWVVRSRSLPDNFYECVAHRLWLDRQLEFCLQHRHDPHRGRCSLQRRNAWLRSLCSAVVRLERHQCSYCFERQERSERAVKPELYHRTVLISPVLSRQVLKVRTFRILKISNLEHTQEVTELGSAWIPLLFKWGRFAVLEFYG